MPRRALAAVLVVVGGPTISGCGSEGAPSADPSSPAARLGVPAPASGWPFASDTNPPVLNAGVDQDEALWLYLGVSTVGSGGYFPADARVSELGRANDDGHAIIALPPGPGALQIELPAGNSSELCTVSVEGESGEVLVRDVVFLPASSVVNPECGDISDVADRR